MKAGNFFAFELQPSHTSCDEVSVWKIHLAVFDPAFLETVSLKQVWIYDEVTRLVQDGFCFFSLTHSSTAFKMSSLKWTSAAVNPNDDAKTIVKAHRDVTAKMSMVTLFSWLSMAPSIWSALSTNVGRKLLMIFDLNEHSNVFRWSPQDPSVKGR